MKYADAFFPPLSTTVLNDSILLPVVPPFSPQRVYSTYVYHNDKFFVAPDEHRGQPRNEHRLYLNRDIDPNRLYLPDDIVVLERVENEGEVIPTYYMYRYSKGDEGFGDLESLLDRFSPVAKKGHFLADSLPIQLPEIAELKPEIIIADDAEKLFKQEQEMVVHAVDSGEAGPESSKGAHLFTSTSFRDFVLHGYDYKCAITGEIMFWEDLNNLEAAHIQPRAHIGTFLPCNGIALCRDMHWAFDKGFITLTNDLKVRVHDDVNRGMLAAYHGKKLYVPVDPYFRPEPTFVKYHQENIFGLFKNSGGIRRLGLVVGP